MATMSASLFQKLKKMVEVAKKNKSLLPIETISDVINDDINNCKYLIKIPKKGTTYLKTSNLELEVQEMEEDEEKKKIAQNKSLVAHKKKQHREVFDVFTPPEKDLYVTDVNQTHFVVLNKFQVVDYHLLVLTKKFQPQTDHLTLSDVEAVLKLKDELNSDDDWLVFYNRGLYSGASQPHKHVQLIPVKDDNGNMIFPLIESLDKYAQQNATQVPEYHFKHAFVPIDPLLSSKYENHHQGSNSNDLSIQEKARIIFDKYIETVKKLNVYHSRGIDEQEEEEGEEFLNVICENQQEYEAKKMKGEQSDMYKVSLSADKYPSFNLLFTSKWMVIVPRHLESYHGISINSLGFMFSFFTRTEKDKNQLVNEIGFMNLLKNVTFPKDC